MLSSPVEDQFDGNILINFNDLNSFLSPKLAICPQCRKCKPEIKKVTVSGFCTGLEIICEHCAVIESQQKRQQRHFKDKICLTRGNERKKSGRQLRCLNAKLTEARLYVESKNKMRLQTTKHCLKNTNARNSLQY